MANEQNLVRGEDAHKLTAEEQSRGGKASGVARRKKKAFKELFEAMLAEDGGKLNGRIVTKKELITARALQLLLDQDRNTEDRDFLKALEIVRDTVGEKPVDKVMVSEIEQDVVEEVESAVLDE